MGLYLTIPQSITSRRAQGVFVFERNAITCLFDNQFKVEDIYTNESGDNNYHYEKILEYASNNKLEHIEIALPDTLDNEQVEFVFEYLSNYLLDKEISIGLLVTNRLFIDKYQEIIDYYGVTIINPFIKEIVSEKVHFSKAQGHELSNVRFCLVDVCGSPRAKKSSRKPKADYKNVQTIKLDESFHDKLMRHIIESGMGNVEIYKKAGITKQVFSKIVSSPNMIPKKDTIICLIIGLELPLYEGKELLKSAGYALSKSIMLDSIVMKYIVKRIYNYDLINSELNEYGCPLLGWKPREDN